MSELPPRVWDAATEAVSAGPRPQAARTFSCSGDGVRPEDHDQAPASMVIGDAGEPGCARGLVHSASQPSIACAEERREGR